MVRPPIKPTVPRPEALAHLLAKLNYYRSIATDLDAREQEATLFAGCKYRRQIAPIVDDVNAALQFLAAYPTSLLLPTVDWSLDGDINYCWEKDDRYADMEFCEGQYSLFLGYGTTDSQEEELLMDLVVEELTTDWIEDRLKFFKE